ncbi:hypothetical protein SEVIR_3G084300v4 [Setaria viridis]|uniref:TF-B3 domain-containing protein n=2 Tax=Setaria TaxID=4554 RepID=K3Z5Y1_SETIT|nr:hypothetical protein SETIT_3G082400v2 [Setaria italica]TKW24951.1 hypothetical protein SEVIR_3G084300v2 [Setaria viridis]
MTITPLGKAAPPKKCKMKTIAALTGGSAGGAVDARNQENAGNSQHPGCPRQEPKVAVQVALVLPLPLRAQEPEKPKRRRDASTAMFWVSKKPRSSVAAARERGSVIAEANRAAADATPSPIVQEPAVDMDGGEPICKKARRSPGGSIGGKEEQKLRPFVFADPVHGLDWLRQDSEVAVLDIASPSRRAKKSVKRDHHKIVEEASRQIKRSCSAPSLAVCKGSNGTVDQENIRVLSDPPTGRTPESASRRRRCKTAAKHSDRKTTRQPFMRLSPELHRLGLTNVTPIVSKILTSTDCNLNAHRLLLPRESILSSPLMSMLTQEELGKVNRGGKEDGVPLELLDQHGRSYQIIFKFLNSDKEYRLIGEWTMFVKHNGMRKGDVVDLGASRSKGRLLLMLLHHAMEDQNSEEAGAAEGTGEEWVLEKIEAVAGAGEEPASADMEDAGSMEWTLEEMEAAEGLLALSHFKDGTKL